MSMFAFKTMQKAPLTFSGLGAYQLDPVGVGAYQLWSAETADGATVFYYVENEDGSIWERGWGVFDAGASPQTITRNFLSSSTGSPINWQSTDAPIYICSVPDSAALDHSLAPLYNGIANVPAWLQAGMGWLDYRLGLATAWIKKAFVGGDLTNPLNHIEEGRHYFAAGIYTPSPRRPFTAVGAASKTIGIDDIGYRFSFDTAAAARTVTLPPIATARVGFAVDVIGLSTANGVILALDAGDTTVPIDFGSAGASLTLPGRTPVSIWSDGTQWRTSYVVPPVQVVRSHLAGLTLSAAGSTATFGIAAGQAADGGNVDMLTLAAAYTKTASAWAVGSGNGSLDTGTIANNTWYHVWLIKRQDTGVVDVLVSTSASAPTMPANYTSKRRIGAMKTDGSAQWVAFAQDGDAYRWKATVLDVNATNPGTSAVTATLGSVPTGLIVTWIGNALLKIGSNASTLLVSDLAANDEAPIVFGGSVATPGVTITNDLVNTVFGAPLQVRTNTSAQVRYRVSSSDAAVVVGLVTQGWIDRRGRDA